MSRIRRLFVILYLMEDTNKKTIESYEASINDYIQNTPNKRGAAVERWIDKSVRTLKHSAKILEIGSAYGRDAKIIEEKGFHVEKTDATKGFVAILQEDDPAARVLDIITDEIHNNYDLIIANAVLLHFNDTEIQSVTNKVFNGLNTGGIFSFTVKQGEGEAWQNNKDMGPRFFNYWSKEGIIKLLTDAGFTDIDVWTDSSDGSSAIWIMVIAKKP